MKKARGQYCLYIKRHLILFARLLMLVSVFVGCTILPVSSPVDEKGLSKVFMRGTVSFDDGVFSMRLCNSSNVVTLKDQNNQLLRHFTKDNLYPSLYVELDVADDQTAAWNVIKIWFVSQKPKRCQLDIRTLDYKINGIDGYWESEVVDNIVSITKKDLYSKLNFINRDVKPLQWKGQLSAGRNKEYKMLLTIKEQVCRDDSDQWYALQATLKLNNEVLLGCVRKGDSSARFIEGNYSSELERDSAFIVLNLQKNNHLKLIIDYRNGHPIVIKEGDWKISENRVLSLNLDRVENDTEQSIILFQMFENRMLRQKGYSDILGKEGLSLLPSN